MPVKTRSFSRLFAAFLAFSCLASCARTKKDAGLELAVFSDPKGTQVLNGILQEFELKTGIKSKPMYIPWNQYTQKLITLFASGQAPDLIWVEVGFAPKLEQGGVLEPLDTFVKRDKVDLKAHYPQVLKRFTHEGRVYGIPQDTAPVACLYYNKALFKAAGLKYPNAKWRWKEFQEAAVKLTRRDKDGRVQCWGFKDHYGTDWLNNVFANGGRTFDDWKKPTRCTLDSPEAIEGVQFTVDLMHKLKAMPEEGARESMANYGTDMLMAGKVAMFRSGYWPVLELRAAKDLDWDMAPFPMGPKARSRAWGSGGSGWSMSSNARDKEKAWKLLKHLTSAEIQAKLAASGNIQPSLMALAKSKVFMSKEKPDGKAFMLDAPNYGIYWPEHPMWDEVDGSILKPKMDLILNGTVPVAQGMKEITAAINKKMFGK